MLVWQIIGGLGETYVGTCIRCPSLLVEVITNLQDGAAEITWHSSLGVHKHQVCIKDDLALKALIIANVHNTTWHLVHHMDATHTLTARSSAYSHRTQICPPLHAFSDFHGFHARFLRGSGNFPLEGHTCNKGAALVCVC